MTQGLYIHVPFCRQKCLYCDFYSVPYVEDTGNAYITVLLKQIKELDNAFSTIYIGGGTPGVLSMSLLNMLLSGLGKFIKKDVEVTIEVNPESADKEKLRLFLDKGVNRVSIGAQSFNDKKLKSLGRVHNARQAEDSIAISKKSGFKNISIDMIFGVSGENLADWQDELEKAAGFDIQHASCYSLSYEKDTPLFKMKEDKDISPLDDETIAKMYQCAMSYLSGKGFNQYEVSNFARLGFECVHNLHYWDNNPYRGLGPSAVSYVSGVRSENVRDVEEYIDRYEKGVSLIINREKLSGLRMAKETASVKIRTRQGIGYSWFKNKTGFDFKDIEKNALEELFKDNLLEYNIDKAAKEKSGIKLSGRGFLFADTVSSAFL